MCLLAGKQAKGFAGSRPKAEYVKNKSLQAKK